MLRKKKKKLFKIIDTCHDCDRILTLMEKAFNETLCYECQRKANEDMWALIHPMLPELFKNTHK